MKKILLLVLVLQFLAVASFAGVRTVIFMQKETVTGQDIFVKGGHDAGLVPTYYPSMSEPITYNNIKNATTAAIKAADASLDWGSESALDWTCNLWPAAWGAKKTYAVDGYGEDPENTWGLHWWKFDVAMDGASGEWYEFKAFMRQGTTEWWEANRVQAGTPYATINHWGKKGYLTRCTYDQNWVEFTLLGAANQPPVASFTATPATGTVATSFTFNAAASTDPEGAALQYRWDYNNDGTFETGWSATATATTTFTTIGTKTVKVEVRDPAGLVASTTRTVTVNNTAPNANFTVTPGTGTTTTAFAVDASTCTDLEDAVGTLQVRWDWENDGTFDTAYSATKTASKTYATIGTKTIKLEVKDSQGLTAVKTLSVTVANGGDNPHPGYYSGKLGAQVYSNGVEYSIWWRSDVVSQVYLAGTFNAWNPTSVPMTRIAGGVNDNVWWTFVPASKVGDEYKIAGRKAGQALTNMTWVSDPYAKYNRYSNGNSVVVNQKSFTWTDSAWTRPTWDYYSIYELHVKDFTSADPSVTAANRGKYLGVKEKLAYIKSLGMTAIHLMPISEFGDVGYSWGYNTSLYQSVESGYAVNPSLGQEGVDQFKALVNEAHAQGIAVILDMVFNHTGNGDNHLWQIDNVAYFDFNADGNPLNDQTPWGNKLNTRHPVVHKLAKDTLEYFMKECHVDGFRFDATHTDFMDHDFVRALKGHVSAIDPNVYMVYENLPNQSDLKTWGGQWVAEYRHRGKDLLCGWNSINANYFAKHIYYTKDYGCAASPVESMNYLESHDEDTLAYLFGIAGFNTETMKWKTRAGAVMLGTSLGIPMLWMGQEFLRAREGQNSAEMPLNWTLKTTYQDINDYYGAVFRLRRDNPALRIPTETGFAWQYTPWTGDANVVGYSLTTANAANKKFVVLLNFNGASRTVTLGFPANGTWTKVITETAGGGTSTINVSGNAASVTIMGNSGIIFQQ